MIASSGYEPDGRTSSTSGVPDSALAVATAVAQSDWQPDPAFAVDVCESEGAYKVLELNSFRCSDLYGCDFDPIVASLAEIATRAD